MKKSQFSKLDIGDIAKGMIVAGIMGGLVSIYDILQSGVLPTKEQLLKAGLLALGAAISYLLKNVFTNSADQFAKKEPAFFPTVAGPTQSPTQPTPTTSQPSTGTGGDRPPVPPVNP